MNDHETIEYGIQKIDILGKNSKLKDTKEEKVLNAEEAQILKKEEEEKEKEQLEQMEKLIKLEGKTKCSVVKMESLHDTRIVLLCI